MSLAALFVVGFVITLVVGAAVGLLIYAAVLDGRRQDELSPSEPVRVAPDAEPLAAA